MQNDCMVFEKGHEGEQRIGKVPEDSSVLDC